MTEPVVVSVTVIPGVGVSSRGRHLGPGDDQGGLAAPGLTAARRGHVARMAPARGHVSLVPRAP